MKSQALPPSAALISRAQRQPAPEFVSVRVTGVGNRRSFDNAHYQNCPTAWGSGANLDIINDYVSPRDWFGFSSGAGPRWAIKAAKPSAKSRAGLYHRTPHLLCGALRAAGAVPLRSCSGRKGRASASLALKPPKPYQPGTKNSKPLLVSFVR